MYDHKHTQAIIFSSDFQDCKFLYQNMKNANETSDSGVSLSTDLTKSNLDDTACCRNSLLDNTFLDSSMSDDLDCKRKVNRYSFSFKLQTTTAFRQRVHIFELIILT
jgi:hypothetical protein